MSLRLSALPALIILLSLSSAAKAQQLTVQQPEFQIFSTNTTVVVPDRGEAFLGGMKTARSSRSSYGFSPFGSTLGLERSGSTMSVSVYIHDFAAMDEYLLNQASPLPSYGMTPYATHAYSEISRGTPPVAGALKSSPEQQEVTGLQKAAKYLELGLQAEQDGKPGVARLHYQMAARHGSEEASQKLTELQAKR